MSDYWLGVVTTPAIVALLVVAFMLTRRGGNSREWCDCGEFDIRPLDSAAPFWWWDIRWAIHRRTNKTHKAGRTTREADMGRRYPTCAEHAVAEGGAV